MSPVAVCQSKVRYKKGFQALEIAKRHSKQFNNTMTPYNCDICYGWHLRSNKMVGVVKPSPKKQPYNWAYVSPKMISKAVNLILPSTPNG